MHYVTAMKNITSANYHFSVNHDLPSILPPSSPSADVEAV